MADISIYPTVKVIELLGTAKDIELILNNNFVAGWELASVFSLSTKVYAILLQS